MNRDQMVELWEQHTAYEFELRDAHLAVSTMVDDATVMHLPTMSGGERQQVRPSLLEVGGDLRELVSQGTDDPIILGANRFSFWLVEH